MMLQAKNIATKGILHGIDLDVKAGEFVGLLGPNGAGKTSLLRALMKMDARAQGECNLWELSEKPRARAAGWLAQERNVSWDMTAQQVVELGRIPWRGFAGRAHQDDRTQVQDAIARLGLEDFASRIFAELSGGERARVLLARLLAQNTPLILADEPIAALDPRYQLETMSLMRTLADDGRGVMISIHDLGLAAKFCTRLVLIDQGEVVADGVAGDVLSDENIAKVFGITVQRLGKDAIQPHEII